MKQTLSYRGYRFPPDIIAHAVSLYHRFTLSLPDIEDLLAERAITVSYETIRQWCATFKPHSARRIKKSNGPRADSWFLDEVTLGHLEKFGSSAEFVGSKVPVRARG